MNEKITMLPKDRQALQTINLPFIANQQLTIPVNGNYIKYESGTGSVKIITNEGVDIVRDVGGAIKCTEFIEVKIQDLSGADDTKVFTIGYGEIKDNSVSGTIDVDTIGSITDPVKQYKNFASENGNCFIGYASGSNIGATYSHGFLNNPVDSLVNLKLNKITVQNQEGASYQFKMVEKSDMTSLTNQTTLTNKKLGEAVGSGKLYGGVHSAQLIDTEIHKFIVNNDEDNKFKFENPIIITPDNSFGIVLHGTTGVQVNVLFEWEEIII